MTPPGTRQTFPVTYAAATGPGASTIVRSEEMNYPERNVALRPELADPRRRGAAAGRRQIRASLIGARCRAARGGGPPAALAYLSTRAGTQGGAWETRRTLPWQANAMTDDKPEPTVIERATASLDEFMATVLRHIRTGQGSPLEELGLQKAAEELQNWRPDVPGAGTEPGRT